MVDVDRILKNTVSKGTVSIGTKQTTSVVKNGKAKLVVIATNCPSETEIFTLVKKNKVPLYQYQANSVELGYACGKNFPVSVFAVLDDGNANVMQLVK